jgi:lipoprotein-anchoring transpeptidase ErfK/SrfK
MYARDALRRGDMTEARQWAERAAELAPQTEDPWLILAAVASPRESVDYVRKALQANPESPRARKGMEWAMSRLGETPERRVDSIKGNQSNGQARSVNANKPKKRSPLFPLLLVLMGCAVFGFAAWSAMTSPALASILSIASAPKIQSTHVQSFAQAEIPKPTYAVPPEESVSIEPVVLAPSAIPTDPSTVERIDEPLPTATFVPEPTITPEVTSTPGTLYAEIVPDTPTPEYVAQPTDAPYVPPQAVSSSGGGAHWIDVDLSQQRVYAYEGDTIVNSFIVSTGTWQTPTVTGKYKVWIKLRSTDMAGPGYYLPDVPYTMYFYKGYALHGTYWHNNFGTPMSHGCVNLSIPDAAWLYDFSAVGTVVNVHY